MDNTLNLLFELLIEKMKLDFEGVKYRLVFIRQGETKETAINRYCKENKVSKKSKFAFASIDYLNN